MTISATNLRTLVSGVGEILKPVAVASAAQRFVGQPEIL
jgi:hypothetical protein